MNLVSGKVCADIRGGSLKMGRQTTAGLSTIIFIAFAGYIFGTFTDKSNFIIQRYGVPLRLSIDPKTRELNDLERLFYTLNSVFALVDIELFAWLSKTIA